MKNILFVLALILATTACKKTEKPIDGTECIDQMIIRYKAELICKKDSPSETHLFSGLYKQEKIYFVLNVCPNCNTFPITFGYNCQGKKVAIQDFNKVTENKKVYDSCTGKKVE